MRKNLPLSSINRIKYVKYIKPFHYKLIILGDSFSSVYFNSIYRKFLNINTLDTLVLTNNPIIENKLFWPQYAINNCEKIDFRNPHLEFFYDDKHNFEDVYNINFDLNEIKLLNGKEFTYDYLFLSQDPIINIDQFLYEEFVNELSNIYANFNLETSDILRERIKSNYNEEKIVIFKENGELDNFENPLNLCFLMKEKYKKSEVYLIIKGNNISNKPKLNEKLIDLIKNKGIILEFIEDNNYELDNKNDFISFNNIKIKFDLLIYEPKREFPNYYYNNWISSNNFQNSNYDNVFISNDNFEFSYSNYKNKIKETKVIVKNMKEKILTDWELKDSPDYIDYKRKDKYFLFNKRNQIIKIKETTNNNYKITKLNKIFNYYYFINIEMFKYQILMKSKWWLNNKSKFNKNNNNLHFK